MRLLCSYAASPLDIIAAVERVQSLGCLQGPQEPRSRQVISLSEITVSKVNSGIRKPLIRCSAQADMGQDGRRTPGPKGGCMSIARRLLLTAGAATLSAPAAHAQEYPTRAVRVIVPYAAGGTDQYIRLLQQDIAQALGQPVLIDLVVGGGGGVGANRVRTSAPDGYTLLFAGTAALTVVPRVQNLPYTSTDFAPVCSMVAIPIMVAAKRNAPFRTMPEMLARRARSPRAFPSARPAMAVRRTWPGRHGARGRREAAARALSRHRAGDDGAAGGQIDLVVGAPGIVMPTVELHGIVPLAQTGATRIAALPDLITLKEAGLDVDLVTRFASSRRSRRGCGAGPARPRFLGAAAAPTYAQAMRRAYNEVLLLDRARLAVALAEEDRVSRAPSRASSASADVTHRPRRIRARTAPRSALLDRKRSEGVVQYVVVL